MIRLYRFLLSTKEEIYDLYRNSLLKPYTKRSTMEYIDEFYGIPERESGLKRNICDHCR
jgi:histone acetyltransferase (RNA polymerase elongator complex component)